MKFFTRETIHLNLDVILEGLPRDFESLIPLVAGKFDSIYFEEVETLLSHEALLERFQKQTIATTNLSISSDISAPFPTPQPQANMVQNSSHSTDSMENSSCFGIKGRHGGHGGCGLV